MFVINSVNNQFVKLAVKLKANKYRKIEQKFVIESCKFIITALEAGLNIYKLFITKDVLEKNADLSLLISTNLIIIVTEEIVKKITSLKESSGALAIFNMKTNKSLFKPDKLGIVLDNIVDPGNMGTLIRTAAACNIKDIIIIDGADNWGPKVIQASAGTIALVNIYNFSWQQLLAKTLNIDLYGLVVSGGRSIFELSALKPFGRPILFVIGNESNGINLNYINNLNQLITLPMPGGTESLNAGVAGSVALYLFSYLRNSINI